MRKPDSIAYWVADRLPVPTACGLALQQLAFLGALLVVPNLFVHDKTAYLGSSTFLDIASASLIGCALSILLQIWNRFGIGSGYYYPVQATPTVFATMFLAASGSGGMPLAYGMVFVTGLTQVILSVCVVRLRSIFTVEIAGLAVMLTGISIGQIGIMLVFQPDADLPVSGAELLTLAFTLFVMVFCSIWLKTRLRLFSTLMGLILGSALAWGLGLVEDERVSFIASSPWFRVPSLPSFGWQLDWSMVIPYMVIALSFTMQSIGTQTVAQRAADADWSRPDLRAYGRGLRAEGIAHMLASFINALPQTSSGAAVGLAAASGSASRYLGYWVAGFMVLTALCSKVIVLWLAVPSVVIAALLIYLAAFLTMGGIGLVASRMLDERRSIALGIGLIVGVSNQYIATGIENSSVAYFVDLAGVANGTLVGLLLTVLFRIGASRRSSQVFTLGHTGVLDVNRYMEEQGRLWGARRLAVQVAEQSVWQAVDLLAHSDQVDPGQPQIEIASRFDEYALRLTFTWKGKALPPPTDSAPSPETLLHDPEGTAHMTSYLLSRMAKRMQVRRRGQQAQLVLYFDA